MAKTINELEAEIRELKARIAELEKDGRVVVQHYHYGIQVQPMDVCEPGRIWCGTLQSKDTNHWL